MPANKGSSAPQPPDSPNTKAATARYTNKDGSKMITVPKAAPSTESSQPSTPTLPSKAATSSQPTPTSGVVEDGPAQQVNRKKAKRRAKAAAKAAAAAAETTTPTEVAGERTINGQSQATPRNVPASTTASAKYQIALDPELTEDEDQDTEAGHGGTTNGNSHGTATATATSSGKSKKHKKKKKKNHDGTSSLDDSRLASPSPSGVRPLASAPPRGPGISKEKIWDTDSQEERERIKEFWLGLGEEDRKSLVKVEKDAVLRKMKEQQKHTCSCTVCGRKRIAIEEELEGLYDAYYEELEQFANQADGPPLPRDFPVRPSRMPSTYVRQPPSRGRIVEHVGDDDDEDDDLDEDEDEEYSEGEELDEDDEYSVDEPPEDVHPHDRDMADFLTFGNSLQVKGGILTVADDLLKNDGKRFIEMMEQLAERRMAREEDAKEHVTRVYGHPAATAPSAASATSSNPPPHGNANAANANGAAAYPPTPLGQPAPDDEYEDEDDEEEEYEDSQDDEYEDEEDTMTEEQRMEEGRRMFQIFAARMFEQRVLTAYRNMVAQQRQNRLLEEIDEEKRKDEQRKAKRAKDAQKRKDKAALKKQAQAEERARKEAERAAEEAARVEEQRRRAEEQRLKAEGKRRKKEEQKRLEEEERQRKEAERQRRLQEQEKKRAEQERKAREAKEREKKLKEEARQREREARELKEKQQREKKEKQERERREREAKAKAEREAKAKANAAAAAAATEREARERQKQEERTAAAAAAQKAAASAAAPGNAAPTPSSPSSQQLRRSSQHPVSVPNMANVPTVLPQHPSNSAYASPKVQVATPALPKAPTPIRPKNTSTLQAQSQVQAQVQSQAQSQHESSAAESYISQSSQYPSPHPATPAQHSPAPIPFAPHQQHQPHQQQYPLQHQHQHQQQSRRKGSGILPPGIAAPGQVPSSASPPIHGRSSAGIPTGPYSAPSGMAHPPGFNMPNMAPPGLHHRFPQEAMFSPASGFRSPGMMTGPPGLNTSGGRGFPVPVQPGPSGFSQPFGDPVAVSGPSAATHTRQASGGFDTGLVGVGPSQPISRPSPIGRPGSIVHGQGAEQADDASNQHLGSSALLDDSEEAMAASAARQRRHAPGPPQGFPSAPFGMDAPLQVPNNVWPNSQGFVPFVASHSLANRGNWGSTLGPHQAMSPMAQFRTAGTPRSAAVRVLLCMACRKLQGQGGGDDNSVIDLKEVLAEVNQLNRIEGVSREAVLEAELLDLADTEGTPQNGGGSFDVWRDVKGPGMHTIRWVADVGTDVSQPRRAVGEIGSPVAGSIQPAPVPSRGQ